ncbi:uncharacterized protein METZ01_LOCUS255970, partial [marine metagenome]
MKKLLIIFSLIIVLQTNSLAANLSQALLEAYTNNAELNAERENINVSKKNLDISKSEFLPTITLKGSKSSEDTSKLTNQDGTGATVTDVNPETRSVKIEQKIFQGFGGVADYEKNKIGLVLADAKLLQTEQKILLKAVEAFSGLIFAKEKFSINKRNVNLSERQVETDRIRLDRGQVSVADLAQSESSLAGSQAKFIQAKNNVITAKLNYENIIGPIQDSSDLNKDINLNLKIPLTLENAIQLSKINNPDLIIAKLEYEQSERDVQIAQSD